MNSNNCIRGPRAAERLSLNVAFSVVCLLVFSFAGCDDSATTDSATPSPNPSTKTGDRQYAYGTKLSFGTDGNAGPYKIKGWSTAEAEGTWTEGDLATLAFTVPPTDSQIIFRATLSGFVKPPELATQPVDVLLNGKQFAHWELAVKGLVQMAIPPEYVRDGELRIDFKLPAATSPKALGVSIDERRLAICFYDVQLVKP